MVEVVPRKTLLPPDVFFQMIEYSTVKTIEPEPRMVHGIQGKD
jgi:hypothetical protein